MRILQVARYGSVKGGTEAYLAELCRGLRDAGHDVALAYRFDPDDARAEVRGGVLLPAITSLGAQPSRAEADEVRRAVAAFAPDVIHVHNAEASWLPGALSRLAPVVSAVHDHRLDCPAGTRYWAAWGRACDITPGPVCLGFNVAAHCGSLKANATLQPYLRWKRLNRAAADGPQIQVFSSFMRDALVKSGIRAPIQVTPYPCPEMPAPQALAREDNRPLVFATGRATKEKGFDLLIDAVGRIETPLHLAIAGSGHHLDALRRKAAGAPSRHRVQMLGWLQRGELASWYAAAGIVAVPSAWPEPFGIVGLEAMAAGKPVVATDIGGVREWLVPQQTGIAVPPRDVEAFAAAIRLLLDDAPLRAAMGSAGRARVESSFTLDAHVLRVLEMYQQARRSWEAAA